MKKQIFNKLLGAGLLAAIAFSCTAEQKPDSYVDSYFSGINSLGKMGAKPYMTAGDKANIIGLQNGQFPNMGGHVRGEMGGVWTHPIKLADGFWVKLADAIDNREQWMMEASDYRTYPYGSEFKYTPVMDGIELTRFQFAPDQIQGVVVEYILKNNSDRERSLSFDFLLKTDLSPVWFSKENNILDYVDLISWDNQNNVFCAKDSIQDWYAVWGTSGEVASYATDKAEPDLTMGQGKPGMINSMIKLGANEQKTISFFVAGSTKSAKDALSTYQTLFNEKENLLARKKELYKEVLSQSRVEIPDKQLETAYNWIKINTKWLEMDLDGYGKFLGAGAVEYPWLFGCDNSYALQGVLASSDFELAKSTLSILKNVSEKVNGNGRIIHEMSTNGFVYNEGNTQETAHYIVAVWKAFEWTGDIAFLKDIYPYVKQGIQWLTIEKDTNGNLYPEGYGIMEVKGLNAELIDVAVYTQQALESASRMASVFGEKELAGEYMSKANTLKDKINTEFWDDVEGSYCDFYGTREQALSVAQGAIDQVKLMLKEKQDDRIIDFYLSLIKRFNRYPKGTQQGWFTNKNWVINTPIETGIAPRDKAIRNLDKIRAEHCGEYGPYLSAVEKLHMMTISTGVQTMSEAQFGRTDECLWYMDKIASTLGRTLPGSINEMMPDYGCPVQAWTIYGVATPLITHIFGIQPEAYVKKVVFAPHIPTGWNELKLLNQSVGTNQFDLAIKRDTEKTEYQIDSKEADWTMILQINGLKGLEYELNGKKLVAVSEEILLSGHSCKVVVFEKK